MKKIISIISILLFVFVLAMPQKAEAWAINCGCHALRKALKADGVFDQEDAEAVAECHGGFIVKVCL